MACWHEEGSGSCIKHLLCGAKAAFILRSSSCEPWSLSGQARVLMVPRGTEICLSERRGLDKPLDSGQRRGSALLTHPGPPAGFGRNEEKNMKRLS